MMRNFVKGLALVVGLSLGACSVLPNIPAQEPNPQVVADITKACTMSGLFKLGTGIVASAVPAGALPAQVIDAGVDKVCADPTAFAKDVSTVEWVVKNLSGLSGT